MSRISLTTLLAATGGRACNVSDGASFDRVAIDSRDIRPGDLFWALRGENHDGHDYVQQAHDRGAVCSVVRDVTGLESLPHVQVDDTRRALADLARSHRADSDALVVGITGSVGKTTTRELVHAVLSANHTGVRSPRNFNNEIGVPLSLLELDATHEYAVVEIAASGPGEIAALGEIARPDVAIVTRVAPAHSAGLGDIERIADEKADLVRAAAGFVVLNGDDDRVRRMAELTDNPTILVGTATHNDIQGHVESVRPGELVVNVDGRRLRVPATGRHHLVPTLAAVAVAREVGMSWDDIAFGLTRFEAVPGRSRVEQLGDWLVVDDTYNASPASMQAGCELLADLGSSRRTILVAGDMLDLGNDADRHHGEIGRIAADLRIDHTLVFGVHAKRVAQEARHAGMEAHRLAVCSNLDTLLAVLDCTLEPGDVVLAKGSRAMRMERVVEWLRERAVPRHCIPSGGSPAKAA